MFRTIRAILSLTSFVSATIVGSILALICGLIDRTGDLVLGLARVWSRILLGAPGVEVRVRSPVPLDTGRPYVFMANHASMIDIWSLFVALPVKFRFIAKKQLGTIPLFGWAMRAGRFIFIDRQNPAASRRSIQEAARRIASGQSVVMFPEGTRTRDGRLLPFKKGGFHLAIESGVDIVPVAIHGTRELMPRGSPLIRGGVVEIDIGTPIPTAGVRSDERDALIAKVRGQIAALLGQTLDDAPRAPAPASRSPEAT